MTLAILVIAIPLLIYVIGALSVARKDIDHPDDYFVAFKRVGVTAFSSSSIAYAFQVSTIYPFLLWGASNFFFVPLINAVCWGLGIFIFYKCFNRYKHFIGKELTLHGFLGEKYGLSVRVVSSYLTIIAFLGFAISETYFGSKVLLSIVEDKNIFYGIIFASLIFVYGYIAYGGQISSIRTDQLQLIVSYIGVFGLMFYLIYLLIINGYQIPGSTVWGFIVMIIYIPIILFSRKFKFIKFMEKEHRINLILNKTLNFCICSIFIIVFIAILVLAVKGKYSFGIEKFINLDGFGIPGLISLILLPLSFQFVDLSNWQRLLSVKSSNIKDSESINKNIRKGLLIYAIESPFTWIVFIFFGALTITALPNYSFEDLLVDIPKQLINSGNLLQEFVGYTFIVSILAIMLSTVDTFIMGIIFTFVYDSYGKTRIMLDSKNTEQIKKNYKTITNVGRVFGISSIVVGSFLFVLFDNQVPKGGELFINLLLTFYAAQLSFFPLIFGILFLKEHPSVFWANLSIIVGAVCGIGVGLYAVLLDPELAWYPILVCFFLSSIIYFIGYIFKKKNINHIVKIFYKKNKFYCKLMLGAMLLIFAFTYIFFIKYDDYPKGASGWELTSYIVTLLYTYWFWWKSDNGKAILDQIDKERKGFAFRVIAPAMGGIGLITIFHIFMLFYRKLWWFFDDYFMIITLFLITIVYMVFFNINKAVINFCEDPKFKNDFKVGLKYIDGPTLLIFCILFFYSIFVKITGHLHDMELFFSGAIAFELLLTSFVWANTETV